MTKALAVTTEIPVDRVRDLLCCALEGGSGYWLRIVGYVAPREVKPDPRMGGRVFRHLDYPVSDGGAVECVDTIVSEGAIDEEEPDPSRVLRLDLAALRRGLALMPTLAPRQWGCFIAGDEDAITGDVFVQCAPLGEVRYG